MAAVRPWRLLRGPSPLKKIIAGHFKQRKKTQNF
jgi:hypothetical protein